MRKTIQEIGKVKSLIKQFSFLETFVGNFDQDDKVVNIKVKKADPYLLSFMPDEYDGIKSYVTHGVWKAKVSHRIITAYNHPTGPENITFSTWDGFTCDIYDIVQIMSNNMPLNMVKSITILTKYEWYDINDEDIECKLHEDKYFTINNIPKFGLQKIIDDACIMRSVVLNSKNFSDEKSLGNTTYDSLKVFLDQLVEKFMFGAYLRGIRDNVEKNGGGYFDFGDVVLVTKLSDDGETVIIELTNSRYYIIFNANYLDDNPEMVWKSFLGSLIELLKMVDDVIIGVKTNKLKSL